MLNSPEVHNRREHKRYFAKDHLIAMIRSEDHQLKHIDKMSKGEIGFAVIKSNPAKMGAIVEISRGGLSFNYIDNEEQFPDIKELDIIFAEKDFHLRRLLIKTIEDTTLQEEAPRNPLSMKRLTVQFKKLTRAQKRKIDHLLDHYTTGEVPVRKNKQAWGSG